MRLNVLYIAVYLTLVVHVTAHSGLDSGCALELVESIPEGLTYLFNVPSHVSTYDAWKSLLNLSNEQLNIASFYWTLLAEPRFNFSAVNQGREIFNTLLNLSEKIQVNIAQSGSEKKDRELDAMTAAGARVYWIDVAKLLGQGIIHTKLWTADSKHAYLGSANMDWRSLTEVKELGVLYTNCSIIVSDLEKVHETLRIVSTGIPTVWPTTVWTEYNLTHPMMIELNGIESKLYFSSSPPEFNPPGRTYDLEAILNTIRKAKKFIYLSVMNYSPEIVYYGSDKKNEFWPVIDNALRSAVIDRGLEVRLLISIWPHTPKTMRRYLSSLKALDGIGRGQIRVRYFIVPSFTEDQKSIPYARVNHNKYMVTDSTGYIGTSNWSGDYFVYTTGIGFVIEQNEEQARQTETQTIRSQLVDVFLRDWNSEYSFEP
ncbi:hypothetical protein EG68_07359 [Paragonimus skrjabini miyazakii]|uniref:PLD phosphodiesterase domain-containing protein n=1 Tax=Paragonimus skrjabini miyazakii TaxID=59628 RepID=A0A8S9Y9K2_9TREM|nr:hypothetical protein EG68_07359 [Paragonimus skrjabini miyazakii]